MAHCTAGNAATNGTSVAGVHWTTITPRPPHQNASGNRIAHAVQYKPRMQPNPANAVTLIDGVERVQTPPRKRRPLNARLQKDLLDVVNRMQDNQDRFAQGVVDNIVNFPEIAGEPSTLRAQHTAMLHQRVQLNQLIMALQTRRSQLKNENAVLRQKNAAYSP